MCDDDNVVYLTWQQHSEYDRLFDRREFECISNEFSWFTKERIAALLDKADERNKLYYQLREWTEY